MVRRDDGFGKKRSEDGLKAEAVEDGESLLYIHVRLSCLARFSDYPLHIDHKSTDANHF